MRVHFPQHSPESQKALDNKKSRTIVGRIKESCKTFDPPFMENWVLFSHPSNLNWTVAASTNGELQGRDPSSRLSLDRPRCSEALSYYCPETTEKLKPPAEGPRGWNAVWEEREVESTKAPVMWKKTSCQMDKRWVTQPGPSRILTHKTMN